MRLRVDQRLLFSYLVLIVAAVAALNLGIVGILRRHLDAVVERDMIHQLQLSAALYPRLTGLSPDSAAHLLGQLSGRRVTLIDSTGVVLGDSELRESALAHLENHLNRPEVATARTGRIGVDVRVSPTLKTRQLYVAAPTSGGVVVRLAVPLHEVELVIGRVRRGVLGVGALAVLGLGLLSLGASMAITRPLRQISGVARALAAGDLSRRVRMQRTDEFGALGAVLDRLAAELQRRLAQLEAERFEMRALIDAMAEGVLALDSDGVLRRANPAAHRIFALPEEPRGMDAEQIDRRPEFLRLVSHVLDGDAVPPTEFAHAGQQLLVTGRPLEGGGAVLVFLDVSELRRLEGVRRDFVANASHELKTPLTAIRGYSETLLDPDLPPELARRFAAVVHANAERLQRIVDDLLDLSRLESGRWQPEPEPLSLAEADAEAWAPFAADAEAADVRHTRSLEEGAERVSADPGALRQVLVNLYSNALRHTPRGGEVRLLARPAPGSVGWVEVEVADTGSGIEAKHLERVFERFYRVDPARSREAGGTGLGLAIVKHLTEAHGGRVRAESALGRGTRILLTLPAPVGEDESHRISNV
jgi:two-component system phosphate regulon sensor histidine kinase PhoR